MGEGVSYEIVSNQSSLQALSRDYPVVVREEVKRALGEILARFEKRVLELTPRGVGGEAGLAGSIHGEVAEYGEGFRATEGTPLEYGEVVELGRRPGKRRPPIEPLMLWLMRKHGLPEEEAKQAAFGLAINIGKFGFLHGGAHMFQKTFEELDPWIMEVMNKIPERVAERIGNGAL